MERESGAPEVDCGRTERRSPGSFEVSAFRLSADYRFGRHAHAERGLVLIARGGWEARTRTRRLWVEPGTAALLPCDIGHVESVGASGARALLIEPGPDLELDGVGALFADLGTRRAPETRPLADRLWRELHAGAAELSLEMLCAELLLLVQAGPSVIGPATGPVAPDQASGWIGRLVERLYAEPARPHRLSSLARDAGVSPEHLARSFRRYTGCTVGDLLRRSRLLAAARTLRETRLPLVRVAAASGFADQSHMNRVFRQYLGTTPAAYRAALSVPGIRLNPPAF